MVTAVFTAVAAVFASIEYILDLIENAAVMLGIARVFTGITMIFAGIAAILATVCGSPTLAGADLAVAVAIDFATRCTPAVGEGFAISLGQLAVAIDVELGEQLWLVGLDPGFAAFEARDELLFRNVAIAVGVEFGMQAGMARMRSGFIGGRWQDDRQGAEGEYES
jgi:hypothetical protein